MPNTEEIKELLSDLGRATLRGVRKCPKCGTYNGTRGLSCKNKACDVVFKEAGEKRKLTTDACRLHTGSYSQGSQVFSVRVRDKGPDYRGFVQLITDSADFLVAESVDADDGPLLTQNAAVCFVDTCQRAFDSSGLKSHEKNHGTSALLSASCQHIQAALRCYSEAHCLAIKESVFDVMACDDDIKQALSNLDGERNGPLVQRVSKTVMAVKCKASPKHPLGYLHFAFLTSRVKDRSEHRHFCSCPEFKGNGKDEMNVLKRCIHFYACVYAFASDPKLSEEFAYYIGLCQPPLPPNPTSEERQLLSILSEALDSGGSACEVEVVLQDDTSLLQSASISVAEDGTITQVHGLEEIQIHPLDPLAINYPPEEITGVLPKEDAVLPQLQTKSKRKREDSASQALLTLQNSHHLVGSKGKAGTVTNSNKKVSSTEQKSNSLLAFKRPEPPDENSTSISFIQWLASVTERINQTMHFQFQGNPDPLVFHVPQNFFDCLRERISRSYGGKKKRLPNWTTAFVRKDSVPLGTFTKYTWHITSILHVKHIFDTPIMPLEIIRSFVENRDGTYDLFQTKHDEKIESLLKSDKRPLIKPLEVRTYLKVGHTSPDQQEPTPFVIEWIPDVLPLSRLGELRIHFQFGHQHGGLGEQIRNPFSRSPAVAGPKSQGRKRRKLAPLRPQQSHSISVLVNPEDVLLL